MMMLLCWVVPESGIYTSQKVIVAFNARNLPIGPSFTLRVEDERRGSACLQRPRAHVRRSLDDQGRFESHRPGHVVEIGRSRHYRLVDFCELLPGAIALDANGVAQVLVALRHGRIDPEESAKIDLAV